MDKKINAAAENEQKAKLAEINYPASQDIYNKLKKEDNIDTEDTAVLKTENKVDELQEGAEVEIDKANTGLDVPGAELDDDMEAIGSEDEENNFYSGADDNHINNDEDSV